MEALRDFFQDIVEALASDMHADSDTSARQSSASRAHRQAEAVLYSSPLDMERVSGDVFESVVEYTDPVTNMQTAQPAAQPVRDGSDVLEISTANADNDADSVSVIIIADPNQASQLADLRSCRRLLDGSRVVFLANYSALSGLFEFMPTENFHASFRPAERQVAHINTNERQDEFPTEFLSQETRIYINTAVKQMLAQAQDRLLSSATGNKPAFTRAVAMPHIPMSRKNPRGGSKEQWLFGSSRVRAESSQSVVPQTQNTATRPQSAPPNLGASKMSELKEPVQFSQKVVQDNQRRSTTSGAPNRARSFTEALNTRVAGDEAAATTAGETNKSTPVNHDTWQQITSEYLLWKESDCLAVKVAKFALGFLAIVALPITVLVYLSCKFYDGCTEARSIPTSTLSEGCSTARASVS